MTETHDYGVTVTHVGGGWYEITNPFADEGEKPERVQGEDKAQARAQELRVQVAELMAQSQAAGDAAEAGEEPPKGRLVTSKDDNPVELDEGPVPSNIPKAYTRTLTEEEQQALPVKLSRVILEENDAIPPMGLFLGHNGKGYLLQAGVEADVPNFLLDILNNAITSQAVTDPSTKQIVGYRNRMRYPYRVVANAE